MPTATASPGTLANDASYGTPTWTNPSNAAASDNAYATVSLAMNNSQYLKCTNFGFTIPTTSVILGITVSIERKSTGPVTDSRVRLVRAGTVEATDKATGTAWPGTDTSVDYGGAADLWSASWTGTDIRDSGFGVVLSCTSSSAASASVDAIGITVTYRSGSGVNVQGRKMRP